MDAGKEDKLYETLKIGDRVKHGPDIGYHSSHNNRESQGGPDAVGVVVGDQTTRSSSSLPIRVRWDNGRFNAYYAGNSPVHNVKEYPTGVHDLARLHELETVTENPKTAIGRSKPSIHAVPPVAILECGRAMSDGSTKYGLMNWRKTRVPASIYYDAASRHMMAWMDGEERAKDSGVHHLAHAMACMAILLDAHHTKTLDDDRPSAGTTSDWLEANTEVAL